MKIKLKKRESLMSYRLQPLGRNYFNYTHKLKSPSLVTWCVFKVYLSIFTYNILSLKTLLDKAFHRWRLLVTIIPPKTSWKLSFFFFISTAIEIHFIIFYLNYFTSFLTGLSSNSHHLNQSERMVYLKQTSLINIPTVTPSVLPDLVSSLVMLNYLTQFSY